MSNPRTEARSGDYKMAGMVCPTCGQTGSSVIDSRLDAIRKRRRRRHMCWSCENRFTTYEMGGDDFKGLSARIEQLEGQNRALRDAFKVLQPSPTL